MGVDGEISARHRVARLRTVFSVEQTDFRVDPEIVHSMFNANMSEQMVGRLASWESVIRSRTLYRNALLEFCRQVLTESGKRCRVVAQQAKPSR